MEEYLKKYFCKKCGRSLTNIRLKILNQEEVNTCDICLESVTKDIEQIKESIRKKDLSSFCICSNSGRSTACNTRSETIGDAFGLVGRIMRLF